MHQETHSYAGRGREGPLRCIFLCEFHPVAGPKITCQVPEGYISKETFDAVSVYLIPKAQLQRSIITVTLVKWKIIGFPIRIDSKKYARNAFYFNLCFVCDAWARSVQYEPVVKKLSDYLITMELEKHFLSSVGPSSSERARLPAMFGQVLDDLNTHKMCTLTEGTTTTHLTVVRISQDPEAVLDHQVPVFTDEQSSFEPEQWDLTTNQVLPYIDGFNHVSRIAGEADVDINLVKSCVQNLVYYGVVTLIPIFQYSNVYAATTKLRMLCEDKELQERCLRFVSKELPALRDVFRMYSGMSHGVTIRDLCVRLNPHPLRINERKLILFGVLEGLIRRVYKMPVYLSDDLEDGVPASGVHKHLTGLSSVDEVCCALGMSSQHLEDYLERDPNVVVVWK
ncbi:GATOR1 complex protein NPRL2-like isoform X2 [Bacillus rossius redtenbacheri]|uniref:GATOR1 complex protein NPRL2-like isoform X2 n=1 Tax=Bacillus rossius redtenbacheri TaxID=93214 RepID=UPI002FDDA3E6